MPSVVRHRYTKKYLLFLITILSAVAGKTWFSNQFVSPASDKIQKCNLQHLDFTFLKHKQRSWNWREARLVLISADGSVTDSAWSVCGALIPTYLQYLALQCTVMAFLWGGVCGALCVLCAPPLSSITHAHLDTPSLPPPLTAFPAAWLKLIPLSVRRPDADVAR